MKRHAGTSRAYAEHDSPPFRASRQRNDFGKSEKRETDGEVKRSPTRPVCLLQRLEAFPDGSVSRTGNQAYLT